MADKIKKFLKDNKGATYSPLAVKQLLVKFIELMSEVGTVKVETSNITALSPEVLDELEVGDVVQKITGNMKHCYIVTYKGDGAGQGICLSYCAAGYMETVSYDRSGSSWVYNSTDVVNLLELIGSKFKYGKYIYDNEEYIYTEDVPSDYSGTVINIGDDGYITVSYYEDGIETQFASMSPGYLELYNEDEEVCQMSAEGVTKVKPEALFEGLTHSFNELDPTIKVIIDSAISTESAVACTTQQWLAIKELLDKSLYINYDGYSMLKSYFNGIDDYVFGGSYLESGYVNGGYTLHFKYESDNQLLFVIYGEI